MAYKKNYLDEEQNQPGGGGAISGGNVLAGNAAGGGQAPQPQQAKGSGWTNLQQYLDMNQGQTGGLSDTFVGANQKVVDNAKALGADLVKNTQQDSQWSKQSNDMKGMADQIKTGDLSKVDSSQYKSMVGQNYNRPQDYGKLTGYGDVLGAFSKASDKVGSIGDYGAQKATLQDEFGKKYQNYTSGMGTLDTFLLRGDKDAQARTAAFKQANQDFVAPKDGSGPSAAFQNQVRGNLDNFFTGQEGAFNTAKGEMIGAVGKRRAGIEGSVTPEMIEQRKSEIRRELRNASKLSRDKAKEQGELFRSTDFDKFGTTKGTLDAADLLSDSDWQALSILEGLDGGRSSIQDQTRGDYAAVYDSAAADALINQRIADSAAAKQAQANKIAAEQEELKERERREAEAKKIPVSKGVEASGTAAKGTNYGVDRAWEKIESWFR